VCEREGEWVWEWEWEWERYAWHQIAQQLFQEREWIWPKIVPVSILNVFELKFDSNLVQRKYVFSLLTADC
jgi:hypothetical protein